MALIYFDKSTVPSLSSLQLRLRLFKEHNRTNITRPVAVFVVLIIINIIAYQFNFCLTSKSSNADCSQFPVWAVPFIMAVAVFIAGGVESFKYFIIPDKEIIDIVEKLNREPIQP